MRRVTAAVQHGLWRWLAGGLVWAVLLEVQAQALRDPTAEPLPAGGGADASQGAPGAELSALSVIVVDGRPHVIMGTRLYAPGQKLGQARIERITETEIWLREGQVLRKVPRYPGIERRGVAPLGPANCTPGTVPGSAPGPTVPGQAPCGASRP